MGTLIAQYKLCVYYDKRPAAVVLRLAKIKIKVYLKTIHKAQSWPALDERAADMMMIGWHSDTEDTNNFFEFLSACANKETGTGQYNSGNYCNPKVDELTIAAQSETNLKKRGKYTSFARKKSFWSAGLRTILKKQLRCMRMPRPWQEISFPTFKNG